MVRTGTPTKGRLTNPAPEQHDAHLREREQTFDETRIEPNIFLVDTADLLNHGIDVGKDGEEGDWLDDTGVAEQEDLKTRQRSVIVGENPIVFFFFCCY